MEHLRIVNGFDRMPDATLLARTNQILADLPVHFAAAPGLAALSAARNAFATALATAQEGGIYEITVKNNKKGELVDQLHLMGNYVVYISAGDRAMAISSGFTFARNPSTAPEITKPENQKLTDGLNAGELQLTFKKVTGARGYLYQTCPDPLTPESNWHSSTGTLRKHRFTGLQSGTRYWCRVAALGIGGKTVYSEPLSRIVQ